MSCRFPGARDTEGYWQLLRNGVDAITLVPKERFDPDSYDPDPEATWKRSARFGGFLEDVDRFDAAFFGISPREAQTMDPAQRLLLEVSWEALEDAGQSLDLIARQRTGVFIGMMTNDYEDRMFADLRQLGLWTLSGGGRYGASGRLSYCLGLEGPSITVDTACSSSAVAVHLACQSLRSGECDVVLAGGAQVTLQPHVHICLAEVKLIASDGRCRFGDARADGFARSEGVGVVVLKRLADALADKDPIHAVILGSAVNSGGRNSNVFVTPSRDAQQTVMRRALAQAGVAPHEIQYVEAHGTGTAMGDVVEIESLGAALSEGRTKDNPCVIGSVKTNIGHAEAASGVAALIKLALCLKQRQIVPSLHFTDPNPKVDWPNLPLLVGTKLQPWPVSSHPARAGLNSFGLTGTNAHLVLEEAPARVDSASGSRGLEGAATLDRAELFVLSAASEQALADRARSALGRFRKDAEITLADLCHTAGLRRTHLAHRLAATCHTTGELAEQLEAFLDHKAYEGLSWGCMRPDAGRKLAFVFPGWVAPDWSVAGLRLPDDEAFQRTFAECDHALKPYLGRSLKEGLGGTVPADSAGARALLFAFQVALSALWRSWGIEPDAVAGSGLGEVAAALSSGAVTLQQAARMLGLHAGEVRGATAAAASSSATAGPAENISLLASEAQTLPAYLPGTRSGSTWFDHVRARESISDTLRRMQAGDFAAFLEISPDPVAQDIIGEALGPDARKTTVLASCRTKHPETFLESVATLYTLGWQVCWRKLYPGARRNISLPAYPWQRDSFWVETENPARDAPRRRPRSRSGHPVLGSVLCVAPETYVWQVDVDINTCPGAEDHCVWGSPVLPGAALIEMALAAGAEVFPSRRIVLERLSFTRMVEIPAGNARKVQLVVSRTGPDGAAFSFSGPDGASTEGPPWAQHASGTFLLGPLTADADAVVEQHECPDAIRVRCSGPVAGSRHYTILRASGMQYGQRFQGIANLWHGQTETLGLLEQPEGLSWWGAAYRVHPALLDACFQVLGAALPTADEDQNPASYIPLGIKHLEIKRPPEAGTTLWVHAVRASDPPSGLLRGDVYLVSAAGEIFLEARGLDLKQLSHQTSRASTQDKIKEWLYALEWRSKRALVPPTDEIGRRRRWLILSDTRERVGYQLAAALQGRGDSCAVAIPSDKYRRASGDAAQLNALQLDDFKLLLLDAFPGGQAPSDVVHLWSLDTEEAGNTTSASLGDAEILACSSVLHLFQAMSQAGWESTPRVWLVSRGAQKLPQDELCSIGAAPLWGLGRVLGVEHSEYRPTLIDLPHTGPANHVGELLREMHTEQDEAQIALRAGGTFVARLASPANAEFDQQSMRHPAGNRPFRLDVARPGSTENLRLRAAERRPPGPGEVEIEIEAAGLNFRDVLSALGLYPTSDRSVGIDIGVECAGRIAAVGTGVDGFLPGDEVVALGHSCFSSFTTTSALLVARKPHSLTFEEAAGVPVVFMTAYHALLTLARLARGERVLIHSATGGVGLAAIQLAQRAGAEIFATAGSEEKREYLRTLGIRHVMNSRSSQFADEVLHESGGKGVDVVLNSLSGDAIERSLSVLAPYGRFVEIGRRDIFDDRQIGLWPFHKNLSYFAVDLGRMMVERPRVCRALLDTVVRRLSDQDLSPVQTRTYPISLAEDAFRLVAQAKHTGKIVFRLRDPHASITPGAAAGVELAPEATYLITGGLGGLGLKVAEWMVGLGARHLVLAGRRQPGAACLKVLSRLEGAGARVKVASVDISVEEQLSRLISEVDERAPLRGIVHAAGVLDDGLLLSQTRERMKAVLSPKVRGTWNLHMLTRDHPLDFFVLFSSASSVLGMPGQCSYAAANAFMDGLAHYRRSLGLPAVSINWGAWGEVGMAAAQANRGERLLSRGLGTMSPDDALEALRGIMCGAAAQVGVMRFSIDEWRQFYPKSAGSPFFEFFQNRPETQKEGSTILERLADTDPASRLDLLETFLTSQISEVIRIPETRIERQTRLYSVGLDSLLALELANRIELHLGTKLPTPAIWNYPTVAALGSHIAALMGWSKLGRAPKPDAHERQVQLSAEETKAIADLLEELETNPGSEGESAH